MTSPVDCPLPDNMAAVALQMQETALQAEAELYAIELDFAAALNRPTWVIDMTTAITLLSANIQYDLLQLGGTRVERFNNTGQEVNESGLFRIPFDGLWQVGFAFNQVPVGVVDNNSYREFVLAHARQTSASALGYNIIWNETSSLTDPNAGVGVDGTVISEFRMQAGDIIKVFVQHGNTSSTITVPNSPAPRFWGTLLSSDDQVVVV